VSGVSVRAVIKARKDLSNVDRIPWERSVFREAALKSPPRRTW
jgi:hypothetical protein